MIFSIILESIGVTEIGLKSERVLGIETLGMGAMSAVSHWHGRRPVLSEILKIWVIVASPIGVVLEILVGYWTSKCNTIK
jgi:hypothetical protein